MSHIVVQRVFQNQCTRPVRLIKHSTVLSEYLLRSTTVVLILESVFISNVIVYCATIWYAVPIAQSVERKTEDLEAACSIHARDTGFFWYILLSPQQPTGSAGTETSRTVVIESSTSMIRANQSPTLPPDTPAPSWSS